MSDKVNARKFVYDTWYEITGIVISISGETLKIQDASGKVDYYTTDDQISVIENALSRKYNTTPQVIARENMNFLQSEGYYETPSKVIECYTFQKWLDLAMRKPEYKITEPWQKGDLGYGL